MTSSDTPLDSDPLDAVTGATSERAAAAFGALSNDTRMAILLALWEAYEPFADDQTVSFSSLRKDVGMRDSGRFNYHLGELSGTFVDAADEGYALTQAGHSFVQSVVAGVGLEDPSLDDADVEGDCPHCGASVNVTYEDQRLRTTCPACDDENGSEVVLMETNFDPAGVTGRTPAEAVAANGLQEKWKNCMRLSGVCPECSGVVDAWFDVCDDHDADGICPRCERHHAIRVRFVCTVCKDPMQGPASVAASVLPATQVFMTDRGYPSEFGTDGPPDIDDLNEHNAAFDFEQELLAEDPLRVAVTLTDGDDELTVTFDENVDVVEIERSD